MQCRWREIKYFCPNSELVTPDCMDRLRVDSVGSAGTTELLLCQTHRKKIPFSSSCKGSIEYWDGWFLRMSSGWWTSLSTLLNLQAQPQFLKYSDSTALDSKEVYVCSIQRDLPYLREALVAQQQSIYMQKSCSDPLCYVNSLKIEAGISWHCTPTSKEKSSGIGNSQRKSWKQSLHSAQYFSLYLQILWS